MLCFIHRQLEVLAVGIACLQIFVQNNWSGPATDTHLTQYTCPECANIPEVCQMTYSCCLNAIQIDQVTCKPDL